MVQPLIVTWTTIRYYNLANQACMSDLYHFSLTMPQPKEAIWQ